MPFLIQWLDVCVGSVAVTKVDTPAGALILTSREGVICQADWESDGLLGNAPDSGFQEHFKLYWENPNQPCRIRLLQQGSPYCQKVWEEMCKIPFGSTMTYSALAKVIGSSARAVGNACRDNPYPLIIPCHRVVSVSGFGGYCGQTAGEMMDIKHKLLAFEANYKP